MRLPHEFGLVKKIVDGARPERPEGQMAEWLTDDVWDWVLQAWQSEPQHRPPLADLAQAVEQGVTQVLSAFVRSSAFLTDVVGLWATWRACASEHLRQLPYASIVSPSNVALSGGRQGRYQRAHSGLSSSKRGQTAILA